MYVLYVLVQYAAVCHYRRLCACVSRHTHTTYIHGIQLSNGI